MKLLLAAALLALTVSPSLAAKTCVIVVAKDRPSSAEIYRHELAHCWNWSHPDQHHKGKPKAGYQAPKPPAKLLWMPVVRMNILVKLSLGLLAWDGILHSTTLAVGRIAEECGMPAIDLPWLLFPTFPGWGAYDAFWAAAHLGAFVVLAVALSQRSVLSSQQSLK